MKKSNHKEPWDQTEKLVTLALERKILLRLSKRIWTSKKKVLEIMKKDASRKI
jgi:hypothetical protein